jgi:hypothetical protein
MSKKLRGSVHNHNAVAILDELAAFGLVVIIFSAGLLVCAGYNKLCMDYIEMDELVRKASDIAKQLRSHERLIYHDQPGAFDYCKIRELENKDLPLIVTVPDEYCLIVKIVDVSSVRNNLSFSFNSDIDDKSLNTVVSRAVVETPINLHMNELEVHAGKLTVILWR